MSNPQDSISSSTLVAWLVGALGILILASVTWVGTNAAHIPAIEVTQLQQGKDLDNIKNQIETVPVIKVQVDNITKQLDHINNAQDSSTHEIEDSRSKISDHERRLQMLETRKR